MSKSRTAARPRSTSVDPRARIVAFIPADGYIDGPGWRVSLVVEGENGHHPTGTWPYAGGVGESLPWFWGHDYDKAVELARDHNRRQGIEPEEALRIVARSMVGTAVRK